MAEIPHFAFPFRLDTTGRPVVTEQDTIDHVRDQVHAALLTRIGQRDERPSWGTPDLAFNQEPLDLESLREQLLELVSSGSLSIEEFDQIVEEGVTRVNVYVSTGG